MYNIYVKDLSTIYNPPIENTL